MPQLMSVPKEIHLLTEAHLRFAPCPNGYATLGHLKGLLLLDRLRSQFDSTGKKSTLHLRFDDNNTSENLLPIYYDSFKKLVQVYDVRVDTCYYASEHAQSYKKAVHGLLKARKAFFCSCKPVAQVSLVRSHCSCSENQELQKTDLKDLGSRTVKFTAISEPPYVIYRTILNTQTGLSQGSPTIALQGPIDDATQGINLILRGRDLESLTRRQEEIYRALYAQHYPKTHYWGRITVWDSSTRQVYEVSKTKLASTSESELPNLEAFYLRGYSPKAIKNWLLSYGFTKHDMKLDLVKLKYYQKKELYYPKEVENFDCRMNLETNYYKSHWCEKNRKYTEKRNFYHWNREHQILTYY